MSESIKLPFRIFAVDPATTKSGWALLEVLSLNPLSIKIIKTAQIDGDKLLRSKKDMLKIFTRQYCVLDALYDEYCRLIEEFNPDVVVSESAFGFSHMSALIALTLAIDSLRRATSKVLHRDLVLIPPTVTKMAFTGHGGADKDRMRQAYLTVSYLIREEDDEEISEHQIDSVGHGVGYLKRDITKEVVQISALDKKRLKREKAKAKLEKLNGVGA